MVVKDNRERVQGTQNKGSMGATYSLISYLIPQTENKGALVERKGGGGVEGFMYSGKIPLNSMSREL